MVANINKMIKFVRGKIRYADINHTLLKLLSNMQ